MKLAWLLVGAVVFTECTLARAGMTVYATDGLARVRPNDPPVSAPAIHIRAARNEYEPFQVVVRAGRKRLTGVRAAASDLKSADGSVIDSSHLVFYREEYVRVTKSSPRATEGTGWYPDALIPFSTPAPKRRGKARFAQAPFNVERNTNQPIWIDVFVPRDAGRGVYEGTVTVTAEGEAPVEIAVRLTVWDFTLPDTPSMRSNFGKLGTDIADKHAVEMNSEAFRIPEWHYGAALAEHRISPIIPNTLYPIVRDDGSIDPTTTHEGLERWIETFHVTGVPLRLLGEDPAGRDRARNLTHLRAMYEYLEAHDWEDMAYVYVLDEPNSASEYEEVRRRAKLVHEAQPGIEVLCTEQPGPSDPKWGTLVGSVDIWTPLWTLFDEAIVAERQRAGDEVWSYTALTQGAKGRDTPYWEIDFPLLDFRIPAWISWRYGLTGMLYWSPVNWRFTSDVWTDPATYRAGGDVYNGEGALIYPGVQAGIDGPVVSMRLKQIREGFEDYEYLQLLADRGDRKFAEEIVNTIARSWTDWNPDPKALYDARGAIARHLVSGE
jgi:hypothetical protein